MQSMKPSGGDDLVLTPRFSPNAQTIVYMSYEDQNPNVYLLDIETGRRELLGDFPGMTLRLMYRQAILQTARELSLILIVAGHLNSIRWMRTAKM